MFQGVKLYLNYFQKVNMDTAWNSPTMGPWDPVVGVRSWIFWVKGEGEHLNTNKTKCKLEYTFLLSKRLSNFLVAGILSIL
jgi:hypothetical protein